MQRGTIAANYIGHKPRVPVMPTMQHLGPYEEIRERHMEQMEDKWPLLSCPPFRGDCLDYCYVNTTRLNKYFTQQILTYTNLQIYKIIFNK